MATAESKYVTTSDGVRLHYVESGVGPALFMLHSWSGTAEQFFRNLPQKFVCINCMIGRDPLHCYSPNLIERCPWGIRMFFIHGRWTLAFQAAPHYYGIVTNVDDLGFLATGAYGPSGFLFINSSVINRPTPHANRAAKFCGIRSLVSVRFRT
jgi:hypothetical protein